MAYILQTNDEQQNQAQQAALAAAAQSAPSQTGGSTVPVAGSGSSSPTNAVQSSSSAAPTTLQGNSTSVDAGGSSTAGSGSGNSGVTTPAAQSGTNAGGSGAITGGGSTTQQADPNVATYGRVQQLNADQATQLANSVANNSLTTQTKNLGTAADQANSTFAGEIAPDIFNNDPTTQATVNNDLATPQSLAPTDISQFQAWNAGYTGPTSLSQSDLAPVTAATTAGNQYFSNLNTDAGRQAALQSLYQSTMNGKQPTSGESAFDSMLLQNNDTINPIFNTAAGNFNTNAANTTNQLNTQAAGEVSNAQTSDNALQDYINSQYGTTNTNFQNTINNAVTQDQQNYAAQQAALTNYLSSLNTPAGTLTRIGGADNPVPNNVAPTYDAAGVPIASPDELSALGLSQAQLDSLAAAEKSGTTINPLTYLNTTAPTYNPNTVATSDQVAYYNALQNLIGKPNSFLNEPGTAGGSNTFDYNNALAAANVQPTVNPTVNGGQPAAAAPTGGGTTAAQAASGVGGLLSGAEAAAKLYGQLTKGAGAAASNAGLPMEVQSPGLLALQGGDAASDAATAYPYVDNIATETTQPLADAAASGLGSAAGTGAANLGGGADDVLMEVQPTAGADLGDATGADLAGGSSEGSLLGSLGEAASVVGAAYAIYNAVASYQSGATGPDALNGATAGAAVGTAIFPGVGTLIGAAVGALIGSVASAFGGGKKDPETAIANTYTAAVNAGQDVSSATPQQNFEALAGYFDAKNNTSGHSEPVEQVFGRMQEGPFLASLATQVNSAITSGKVPANATPQQLYSSVILPYINSKGATINTAPGSEGVALTTAITNLIGQWQSGALTGSTPIGISGQTMGNTLPVYAGSTTQAAPAAVAPVAAPKTVLPINKAQQLALLRAANTR